jgi:hypothetical protein
MALQEDLARRGNAAPLSNGAAATKRGPGRPPKSAKPKRGPKPIDLEGIDKRARRYAKALFDIWFPSGLPEHFEIDRRSGEWRIGLTRT